MKNDKLGKLFILIATIAMVAGCEGKTAISRSTNSDETTSFGDGQNSSSSSSSSFSSSSSSSSSSEYSNSPIEIADGVPLYDNYSLKNDTKTCDNHNPQESIIYPASIVTKGVKRLTCPNCGGYSEEFYYDLSQSAFESRSYMYDGSERSLYLEGIVPYGVTVQYENNTLTDIGSKEATAKLFDENGQKIKELKATINVIENTGFPNVRVATETKADPSYKEKDDYTRMTTSVDNCPSKWILNQAAGGIRVRGNSTNQSSVNKRAWRLKFDNKVNMLGLNGGPKNKGFKSWVLLADNFDYSYFRNATAFTFGNTLFNYSGNYASHFQHVNLYMNDEYRGVYLLAEQQQSNDGRISVNEAEDYKGTDVGYIVEIDGLVTTNQSSEDYSFITGNSNTSTNTNPWGGGFGGFGGWGMQQSGEKINGVTITDKGYAVKTDVFSDEQYEFIKKYTNNVFTLFKNVVKGEKLQILDENNDLIDSPYTTQYETLNAVLDLDSFFRMYVLQEFLKNYDCGWGSFYLFVDFSKKGIHKRFTCGAPWDFDLGLGNKSRDGDYKPTGDFITKSSGSMTSFNPWLYLLSQTDFFNDLIGRYYTTFANSHAYEKAIHYINYESSAFANEFAQEYQKWANDSGRNSMGTRKYSSHAEAVTYLTDWLSSRKEYLDDKFLDK